MVDIEKTIQEDLVKAMKAHEDRAVSAIRSVKTAIQNEKTNGSYHELSDDAIVNLIQKLAKQRQESIEIYRQAKREELAIIEEGELEVLNRYLPKMLTETEITEQVDLILSELNVTTMKDMGKVMKELSSRYPNQYDGKLASTIIKSKLC